MAGKWVYQRAKKTLGAPGWWPEKKKIEAVTALMTLGTTTAAAAAVGVPVETIRTWKRMPWWKEMEQQIKDDDNQELDTKFSKIIKKTLDTIEYRLENGNFQYDSKTGKMKRVPVNLRDTHRVMSDLVDKRKVIRNEPITTESTEGTAARLAKLAVQFSEFALGKKNEEMKQVGEIYEGDCDAVHDQRETGLQEGTNMGAQEAPKSS